MKFPLQPPPYQDFHLSASEHQYFVHYAQELLHQALQENAMHGPPTATNVNRRLLNAKEWKFVMKKENVAVYKSISKRPPKNLSTTPGTTTTTLNPNDARQQANLLCCAANYEAAIAPTGSSQFFASSSTENARSFHPTSWSTRYPAPSNSTATNSSSSSSTASASLSSSSSSSSSGGEYYFPLVHALGHIPGSLEEVMYGLVTPTAASMHIKTSYVQDDLVDSQVLHVLESATSDDPFHFIGLKWMIKASPPAFVKPRDFVFLEYTGIVNPSTLYGAATTTTLEHSGYHLDDHLEDERLGFHILCSVDLARCPPIDGICRCNVYSCSLYRQDCSARGWPTASSSSFLSSSSSNRSFRQQSFPAQTPRSSSQTHHHRPPTVSLAIKSLAGPRGKVLDTVGVYSIAKGVVSGALKAVYCAQLKKLAFLMTCNYSPLSSQEDSSYYGFDHQEQTITQHDEADDDEEEDEEDDDDDEEDDDARSALSSSGFSRHFGLSRSAMAWTTTSLRNENQFRCCAACRSRFHLFSRKSMCQLCFQQICQRCILSKRLSFSSDDQAVAVIEAKTQHKRSVKKKKNRPTAEADRGVVSTPCSSQSAVHPATTTHGIKILQKQFKFCKTCLARTNARSAFWIAQEELMMQQQLMLDEGATPTTTTTTSDEQAAQELDQYQVQGNNNNNKNNTTTVPEEEVEEVDTSQMQRVRPQAPSMSSRSSCSFDAGRSRNGGSGGTGNEQARMVAQMTELLHASNETLDYVTQTFHHQSDSKAAASQHRHGHQRREIGGLA